MDNVPAESSGNSELWPRTKEEVDEFLRRASANIRCSRRGDTCA